MVTSLIDDGVSHIELTTRQGGCFSNFRVFILNIFYRNVANEFVEHVSYT